MTTLGLAAGTEVRPFPWTAIRHSIGAVLILAGVFLFAGGFKGFEALGLKGTEWISLSVLLFSIGLALQFTATAEMVCLPVVAILVALVPFCLFLWLVAQVNPFEALRAMYRGSLGSWFFVQNAMTRASPLLLTALCTALPMRVGLVVIGGEGSFVLGSLFADGSGFFVQSRGAPAGLGVLTRRAVGGIVGGLWTAIPGALKHYRGVNETISSLLLIYIATAITKHIVEGIWLDPEFTKKPSTRLVAHPDESMYLTNIDFSSLASSGFAPFRWISGIHMDVHWGFVIGVVACIFCWVLMSHTTFGFGARMVGGNVRAARVAGLPLGRIILVTCFVAGAAGGVGGAIEIAALEGRCSANLIAGYGLTGILVAFLARQNPLAIIPIAMLFGSIEASKGVLQRQLHLPDATVGVLQGLLFLTVLASETYYGRLPFFQKKVSHG